MIDSTTVPTRWCAIGNVHGWSRRHQKIGTGICCCKDVVELSEINLGDCGRGSVVAALESLVQYLVTDLTTPQKECSRMQPGQSTGVRGGLKPPPPPAAGVLRELARPCRGLRAATCEMDGGQNRLKLHGRFHWAKTTHMDLQAPGCRVSCTPFTVYLDT